MISSTCEQIAANIASSVLVFAAACWLIMNIASCGLRFSSHYRSVIDIDANRTLFPPRFRSYGRKLLVCTVFAWVPIVWACLRLMHIVGRRRISVSPSGFSFSSDDKVHSGVEEILKEPRFAQRLAAYEALILAEDRSSDITIEPSVTERVNRHIDLCGILTPHVPLSTGGGAALRIKSNVGEIAVGLEPFILSGLGWLRRQCLRHELCHVLQDSHLEIFQGDWDGKLNWREVQTLELGAQWHGSRELLFVVILLFGTPTVAALTFLLTSFLF